MKRWTHMVELGDDCHIYTYESENGDLRAIGDNLYAAGQVVCSVEDGKYHCKKGKVWVCRRNECYQRPAKPQAHKVELWGPSASERRHVPFVVTHDREGKEQLLKPHFPRATW